MCFCVVLCVCFCAGHFVMVPFNLTCLQCLQYSFFEHLFNLYLLPLGTGRLPTYTSQLCKYNSTMLVRVSIIMEKLCLFEYQSSWRNYTCSSINHHGETMLARVSIIMEKLCLLEYQSSWRKFYAPMDPRPSDN